MSQSGASKASPGVSFVNGLFWGAGIATFSGIVWVVGRAFTRTPDAIVILEDDDTAELRDELRRRELEE